MTDDAKDWRKVGTPDDVIVEGERRANFHRKAARLLMESLDYESTLAAVSGLALPEIGSWSIVDVVEASGGMRRVAIVHADPELQLLARQLQSNWPPETEDPIGAPVVMRTGESQVVSHITDEMLVNVARDEENLTLLRKLGIGSFIVVPLMSRGEMMGAITFVNTTQGRTYTTRQLGLAEDLAALGALALERARMHQESEDARAESEAARALAADRAETAERQRRDMEHIMEIQTRLVRGFSHDVKNPLGAAASYAHTLERETTDPLTNHQKDSVSRIRASIHSALSLIDELVEYAKNKMGKVEVRLAPTSVVELTSEIASEYRAQIEAAGLTLEVVDTPNVPIIQSDRIRIRQILGNLLSNAVKYTSAGTIIVGVDLRNGGAEWPSNWVTVSVGDTGHGISEENQHFIFQEFARLDPNTTQGTGLGLAISQWIADALGARITLESELGRGSTFTLWLPLLVPKDGVSDTSVIRQLA